MINVLFYRALVKVTTKKGDEIVVENEDRVFQFHSKGLKLNPEDLLTCLINQSREKIFPGIKIILTGDLSKFEGKKVYQICLNGKKIEVMNRGGEPYLHRSFSIKKWSPDRVYSNKEKPIIEEIEVNKVEVSEMKSSPVKKEPTSLGTLGEQLPEPFAKIIEVRA